MGAYPGIDGRIKSEWVGASDRNHWARAPGIRTLSEEEDAIGPLARMQAWRDLGAACGPLVTGVLLTVVSAEVQHGIMAVALGAGILYWRMAAAKDVGHRTINR